MIIISILHWKILAWAETKKLHTSKKLKWSLFVIIVNNRSFIDLWMMMLRKNAIQIVTSHSVWLRFDWNNRIIHGVYLPAAQNIYVRSP